MGTSTTTTTTTGDEAAVSGPEGVDAAHGGGIGPTGGSLSACRRRILDCSEGVTVSENRGGEFSIKGHGSEDDEPTADIPLPRAGRGKKRARTVDELHAVAAAGVAETATTTSTTTGDEAAVSGGPEGVDAAHGGGIVGALLHFGRVAEAESRSRARDAPFDPTIAGAWGGGRADRQPPARGGNGRRPTDERTGGGGWEEVRATSTVGGGGGPRTAIFPSPAASAVGSDATPYGHV